jgi:uncharacterized protein YqgV (UPF0045/DUF77 family)
MSSINFNDPYIKNIFNHFSTFEQKPLTHRFSQEEEAEFEVAKAVDDEISVEDHISFIEAVQKLAETLISCTVGVFETRQDGNQIGSIGLIKMLSQLFLVGHQACEDRLKFKWTKDGTKEIEEKIQVYKHLSEAILDEQQLQQQFFAEEQALQVQLEEDVDKLLEQIQPIIDIKQEPEIIDISDDEEKCSPEKKPRRMLIARRNPRNGLNSVTEGCQNDGETFAPPVMSRSLNIPPVIRLLPQVQTSLTYTTGVTVGYSDAGKKPILIVADPKLKENVYTYRSMIRGSYRCTACGLLNVHRYAKLYQGVLYANVHECKGKPRRTVEQEQQLRARKFGYAPLPSLLELSTTEDPRPYPAYPKKRPSTRPQNPNHWEDLVEYANFSSCITNRPGMVGYVAYDNYNPLLCYEYAPSSRGSYRCVSCIRFRKHTIAKVDDSRKVLQSAAHACHGIIVDEFEALQAQRRNLTLPPTNIIEFDDFEL